MHFHKIMKLFDGNEPLIQKFEFLPRNFLDIPIVFSNGIKIIENAIQI